jgi:hypothetical protein
MGYDMSANRDANARQLASSATPYKPNFGRQGLSDHGSAALRCQRPHENAKVVDQCMELKPTVLAAKD